MTAPTADEVAGLVVVQGERHRPAGRRRHHLVLVRSCPWCQCAHTHRAAVLVPHYLRSPSCRPSATYLVQVPTGPVIER